MKFDGIYVAMGAYDSAEILDLVNLMILVEIKDNIAKIDFGLYRALMKWEKGCHVGKKKKLIPIFKSK